MKFRRLKKYNAGYWMVQPCPELEFFHEIGEQWLPRGCDVMKHEHSSWEIHLQLNGESCWKTENTTYTVTPGYFSITPPGIRHWMPPAKEELHFIFIVLDPLEAVKHSEEIAPHIRSVFDEKTIKTGQFHQNLKNAIQLLSGVAISSCKLRKHSMENAIRLVLIEVCRAFDEFYPGSRDRRFVHPSVHRAREMIEDYPNKSWKVVDLAKIAGISESHLNSLFKNEMGISLHKFINRERINRAKILLSNRDMNITQIAHETGFSSSQHFARVFKHFEHLTPSEYLSERS